MLNIGRMAPGGEGYYLASVAEGQEDYYLGKGEAPGRWLGAGAERLGLSGEVAGEQLSAVLEGLDTDGAPLLGQAQRKVSGFDLTFRAPKSVSLLYGLGDTATSREVARAHEAAVEATVGYLERLVLRSRRGRGGAEQVATTGAVAAAFGHRTSRAGDPLLHTHLLVANLAQADDDGRWRTLDSRRLYVHAKTAGYLYQAHLRHELTCRLGLEWGEVDNGAADLAGVPRGLIEIFSQRRAQILEALEARGESSARAAQIATLDTRQAKTDLDPDGLWERWRRQALQAGFDPARLQELVGRTTPQRDEAEDLAATVAHLLGPAGLTAQVSTFTRRDVLRAWADQLPAGAPVGEVEQLADALLDPDTGEVVDLDQADAQVRALTSTDVIRRPDGTTVSAAGEEHRYSTPQLLALEQRLVDQAVARLHDRVAVADPEHLNASLAARPTISGEQAAMVSRLTGSGAGVEVVIGRAGAGKTFALDAARAAWQADGRRVVGTALAARAALELSDGAGIPAFTLDRLLADLDHPTHDRLPAGSVVVVDEAGMVGTRKLARLLDAAHRDDAKVVLVGDPYQLPEIDAGGALRGLANRLPVVELADNRRQTEAWERDALDQLRDGDPTAAVAAYDDHGRIHTGDSAEAVREQLVGDWWHAQTELGLGGVMVAARRSDVADLNQRARARMAADGQLTGPSLEAADVAFQAGDRVLCRRNDRRLGVVNGTRATVTHVDPHQREITVAADDGRLIALPAGYLEGGHLDHAYAITAHKAQGATVEATWVLGSDALYREWGYVALSRGRQANHLYLVDPTESDGLCHDPRPDPAARDPRRQAVADLRRTRAQQLALDHQPAALAGLADATLRDAHEQAAVAASRAAATARRHAHLDEREQQLLAKREAACRETTTGEHPGRRWWRRRPTGDERAQATVELCDRQLAQLRAERAQLDTPPDQDEATRRLEALDAETHRRATERVRAAELTPPAYLAGCLGRRPDAPEHCGLWRQAAEAIETYRLHHGIDDPHRPLGPAPADPAARHEHDQAAVQIQAARGRLFGDFEPAGVERDLPDLEHAL